MITPSAVALLTAFAEQEKDYNWYIHINRKEAILLVDVKQLWETFIMDRDGNSPRTLIYLNKNRIALLIGHLITNRKDAIGKRIISDTLYLEFEAQHITAVLSAAAALLFAFDANSAQYKDYERIFLDYCENDLIPRYQKGDLSVPSAIDLPVCEHDNSDDSIKYPSEVAIFSDPASREKCARYLRQLAKASAEGKALPESFIFVSTGRVDKEDIQKYAYPHTEGELIVLTLSDTVVGEEDLRQKLQRLTETARKQIPENLLEMAGSLKKRIGLGVVILALSSILWLLTRDYIPPQLASLTLQAINVMENAGKPLPRFGEQGVLQLTFTDNNALSQSAPPRLTLDAGAQTLSLPQPCAPADEQGKLWGCPLALNAANPNQEETFTLTIAEVKDRTGNSMEPVTVELAFESAEIAARLAAPIKLTRRDTTPVASLMIHAEGRYGVAAVEVGGVSAVAVEGQAHLWQADVPVPALLQATSPALIVVTDQHGNTFKTRL